MLHILVKYCSFSQKYDKGVTQLLFSLPSAYFYYFSRNQFTEGKLKLIKHQSTFKAAQKLTPSQFCSKNALNEAIFLKNGNFGTHAIV